MTIQKIWTWLKPKLVWIVTGAGLVLGAVLALFVAGSGKQRSTGPAPKRPRLADPKDVEIPKVNTNLNTSFNDKPADDLAAAKVKPSADKKAVIDSLNKDFK